MIERYPVEILTENHLIRGFEMNLDRQTGQTKLVRGNITIDLTNSRPQDVDFVVLVPYRYSRLQK